MTPILARHQVELEVLCRRHRVRRLELFGSAASGGYEEGRSDYDFLVEFEPLPSGAYADAYFGLLEGMEGLLGHPVDLVVASAIRNPYFRDAVERTKIPVYGA